MADKNSSGKLNPVVVLGISGISLGITCICLQIAITILGVSLRDRLDGFHDELLLCYVSSGIWIGALFVLTGSFGLVSESRRKRPPIGSTPARKSYWGWKNVFFVTSVVSSILSIILIWISSTMSSDWLKIALPSPYFRSSWQVISSKIPVALVSLAFLLMASGILSLPVHVAAAYLSWKSLRRSPTSGITVFYGGSPSAINLHRSNGVRQIEVITRPASEVFDHVILATADSPYLSRPDPVISTATKGYNGSTEVLSSYF